MKIKKIFCLLVVLLTALCICTGCKENELKEVAIIKYVTDAPLDDAEQGIIDGLKAGGYVDGDNIHISIYNCNADSSTVVSSVRTAVSKSDLIFAIATPVAQVLVQELEKQEIDTPVLFTAVTDPVASGIISNAQKPGGNVSGTSDINPVADQIKLVKELDPNATKVGFIYTAGEHNSEIQLTMAREAAQSINVEVVAQAINNDTEIKSVTESLIASGISAMYIPTDNKVVASANVVVNACNLAHIPTICGEGSVLYKGATITVGSVNYSELGKMTGEMGVRVLNGTKAGDMPVGYYSNSALEINVTAANNAGIVIPEELKNKATKTR